MSFIDYPEHLCSIVFTQGCPFRCIYCHNPELLSVEKNPSTVEYPVQDILDRLAIHQDMIEGVCITGGEPTIHADLPDFLRKLKALGLLVKLDTNGVNPRMLQLLFGHRLIDFVAMDIKHTWEKYSQAIGVASKTIVTNCRTSMDMIQDSGIPHEFRTTVYEGIHTVDDLLEISDGLRETDTYQLQKIRYRKTLQSDLKQFTALNLRHVAEQITARHPGLFVDVRG